MLTNTKNRSPTSSSSRDRKSSASFAPPRSGNAAALGTRARRGKFLQMLAKFGGLLVKFVEQSFHVGPVETNLCRAGTELVCLEQ